MAGPNENLMVEVARQVNEASREQAIEFMAQFHRATIQRLGSAPGIAVDTKHTRNSSRVAVNRPPNFRPEEGKVPPVMSTRDVRNILGFGMKLGDRAIWENTTIVAAILNLGRAFNPAAGKITGSKKNPQGWRDQALTEGLNRARSFKPSINSQRFRSFR